jgi:hypothetical protein
MERTFVGSAPALPFQFTIRSWLWLMLAAGMVLAFVRPASQPLLPVVLAASAAGAALAMLCGWKNRRVGAAIYWSLLAVWLAALCLAAQRRLLSAQLVGWPFAAAAAGALAGALPSGKLRWKIPACIAGGTLPMLAAALIEPALELWGDVLLTAIVSACLAILADLFAWARKRYRTSYGAWAASLVLAVILGNVGATWLTRLMAG